MKIKQQTLRGKLYLDIKCSLGTMQRTLSMLEHRDIQLRHPGGNDKFHLECVYLMRNGAGLYWNGFGHWSVHSPADTSMEVEAALSQIRAGYYLQLASKHLKAADKIAGTSREFQCEHRGMLSIYPNGERATRS